MMKLVNSPHGQFVSTVWRTSESREMIEDHVSAHYQGLEVCVRKGIIDYTMRVLLPETLIRIVANVWWESASSLRT